MMGIFTIWMNDGDWLIDETEKVLPVLLGSRGDQGESDLRYMEPEPPSTAHRWWHEREK